MNILPILPSRWILENCTYSSIDKAFTFLGSGRAFANISKTEAMALSEGTLNAIIINESLTTTTDLRCRIYVLAGGVHRYFDCFLYSPFSDIYSSVVELVNGDYDEAYVEITSTKACTVQQITLDIESQSYDEVIKELQSELPKLIYDYNEYDFELTDAEMTVGLITANVLKDTDLQGHFSVSFLATTSAEVVMRIYDNEKKCLYSPSIYTINAGKHTIGFPHSYLYTEAGFHNFYVTLQATSGTIKLSTRSLLYTIDGAHMAERLLNAYYKIDDIAAKSQAIVPDPDLIYTIGVHQNTATIRHILPNDIGLEKWTPDFIIPQVKEAAIEFNGIWVAKEKYRLLLTDEYPMIFFTDMDDILWYQYFDETAPIQLANDVVKISAVRGWRYAGAPAGSASNNDAGLVVAYIKVDGKAYYRRYIDLPGSTAYWSTETELEFTSAVEPIQSITCARTNDYRMSFTITDNEGDSYSLLTGRYYQGDAVKSITITSHADAWVGFSEPINPQPVEAWNISNFETYIRFDYPINEFENLESYFSLRDNNNKITSIVSTEKFDDYTIKLSHGTVGGFVEPLRVYFYNSNTNGVEGPITVSKGTTTFALQTFNFYFDAIDYSDKGFGAENIKIADADISIYFRGIEEMHLDGHEENIKVLADLSELTLAQVYWHHGYKAETIEVVDADCSIVLTRVGTSPL